MNTSARTQRPIVVRSMVYYISVIEPIFYSQLLGKKILIVEGRWPPERRVNIKGTYKDMIPKFMTTRKSSCVNARGIPTAAYQVLHLLTKWGTPPPLPRSDGVGGTQGGILPWLGYPPSRSDPGVPEVGYPLVRVPHVGLPTCQGTPCLGTPHRGTPIRVHPPPSWTWLGYPPPPPPAGPGSGTPPPLGVDWQTKWNYYLPSRTTYAVGNKKQVTSQYSDRQREVLLHV